MNNHYYSLMTSDISTIIFNYKLSTIRKPDYDFETTKNEVLEYRISGKSLQAYADTYLGDL